MLVIGRKHRERLFIGAQHEIVITVLEIDDGYRVRLGIEAPREIIVVREEVALRDQARQQQEEEAV